MNASVKKILVVDDEVDMRIFVSTVLETSGYEPLTASSGEDAIGIVRSTLPDLIILDVMMPKIEDGIRTFFQFRTDAQFKHIPIIMLSAIARKTFFHSIMAFNKEKNVRPAEPDAYIEKPPDAEELLSTIKTVLAR
jgi:two-component system phosphate regulon response regulator PhoB